MNRLLIVEDERAISELLKYSFEKEGFCVLTAENGKTAFDIIDREDLDAIILDLMLPDIDGLDICRKVCKSGSTPVIILSAKSDQLDKLIGLEYGADDYITKPFDIREVILRVKNVLKRMDRTASSVLEEESVLSVKDITVNIRRHEVKGSNGTVELTPKEFSLFELLLRNKGTVLSRKEILEKVWGFKYFDDTRTVDIHIQRLRKKLGDDGIITTVFGVGYTVSGDEK